MLQNHPDSYDNIEKDEINNRQLCHFFRAHVNLGIAITQEHGVNIEEFMQKK